MFVSSTTGDGDPPDTATRFHRRYRRKTLPSDHLAHLRFTVLGTAVFLSSPLSLTLSLLSPIVSLSLFLSPFFLCFCLVSIFSHSLFSTVCLSVCLSFFPVCVPLTLPVCLSLILSFPFASVSPLSKTLSHFLCCVVLGTVLHPGMHVFSESCILQRVGGINCS